MQTKMAVQLAEVVLEYDVVLYDAMLNAYQCMILRKLISTTDICQQQSAISEHHILANYSKKAGAVSKRHAGELDMTLPDTRKLRWLTEYVIYYGDVCNHYRRQPHSIIHAVASPTPCSCRP
jgi:hypothetical protein